MAEKRDWLIGGVVVGVLLLVFLSSAPGDGVTGAVPQIPGRIVPVQAQPSKPVFVSYNDFADRDEFIGMLVAITPGEACKKLGYRGCLYGNQMQRKLFYNTNDGSCDNNDPTMTESIQSFVMPVKCNSAGYISPCTQEAGKAPMLGDSNGDGMLNSIVCLK